MYLVFETRKAWNGWFEKKSVVKKFCPMDEKNFSKDYKM